MTVRVLIVDDSSFFRRRIAEILNESKEIKVVGTAVHGKEGVEKALELKPDAITMDYEMPLMDGITAVEQIMQRQPTPILMFSSLTYEGARVTLDALEAGALDFLPKNFESVSKDSKRATQALRDKVLALVRKKDSDKNLSEDVGAQSVLGENKPSAQAPARSAPKVEAPAVKSVSRHQAPLPAAEIERAKAARGGNFRPSIIAIGASTGGPVAVQNVLKALPANFPIPVVIVQHMPDAFTQAFAERLNKVCQVTVKEATDGEKVRPGEVLIAPGGKQMLLAGTLQMPVVRIIESDERLRYKPSVDVTFGSISKLYNDRALAIILTGMGADGREGAKLLKRNRARVWAQDEASCVVYGMPMAVTNADLVDEEVILDQIGKKLVSSFT